MLPPHLRAVLSYGFFFLLLEAWLDIMDEAVVALLYLLVHW